MILYYIISTKQQKYSEPNNIKGEETFTQEGMLTIEFYLFCELSFKIVQKVVKSINLYTKSQNLADVSMYCNI